MKDYIGVQYLSRGKHPRLCTVVDRLTTTRADGTWYKTRYVAKHEFLGQEVLNHDVCVVTIQRGIEALENKELTA